MIAGVGVNLSRYEHLIVLALFKLTPTPDLIKITQTNIPPIHENKNH